MHARAFMLSCRARDAMRAATVERLLGTDWGEPPEVVIDGETAERAQDRQERTARRVVERLAGQDDVGLFLEDDLAFNRHLRHNLEQWPVLAGLDGGSHFFGSLYNPTVHERRRDPERDCFEAEPAAVYGSQAFVVAPATARFLLDRWDEVEGMQDIKMSRLAAQVCPVLYHVPSLVQHVGAESAWGGAYHTAPDFDADWRAVPADVRRLALERMGRVEGWLSEEEGAALVRAVAAAPRPGAIVAVGATWGRSTVVLGTAAEALSPGERVYAVDPHEGEVSTLDGGRDHYPPTLEAFRRAIAGAGLEDVVVSCRSRSYETPWEGPIGLLFVDGLHDYENVARDARHFLPWLADGGLVAFHDHGGHFPDVQAYVDELLSDPRFARIDGGGTVIVVRWTAPS